jgi:hypothetical protein
MTFMHERRAAPRFAIFLPVEIGIRNLRLRGHLLEVSAVGVLVYVRTRAAIGEHIELCCECDLGAARVAWCDGARLGAAFEQPLSEEQLAVLLANREKIADAFAHRLDAAMAEP